MRSSTNSATGLLRLFALIVLPAWASCFTSHCSKPPLASVRHVRHSFPDTNAHFGTCETRRFVTDPFQEQETQAAAPLTKLFASPLGALLILAGVILFHESGHYIAGRALGLRPDEFSIGWGPKLAGFQVFGDSFNLRALPVGGYVSFPAQTLHSLPVPQQVFIFSMGVVFNWLLSFLIYLGEILVGPGLASPRFEPGILVTGLTGPQAPASGVLRQGDLITGVDGTPLAAPNSFVEAQKVVGRIISKIQATKDGDSLEFQIRSRGGGQQSKTVRVAPQQIGSSPPSLGIFVEPNLVRIDKVQTKSLPVAAQFASSHVVELIHEIGTGVVTLAKDFVSGKADSSEYRMGGPVRAIETASQVVKTRDWNTIFLYTAVMSINLGVINLAPVPPSDGFQIVWALLSNVPLGK